MFTLYILQGLKFLFWDLPKEKVRDEAKKKEITRLDIVFNQSITAYKTSIQSEEES